MLGCSYLDPQDTIPTVYTRWPNWDARDGMCGPETLFIAQPSQDDASLVMCDYATRDDIQQRLSSKTPKQGEDLTAFWSVPTSLFHEVIHIMSRWKYCQFTTP